MRSLPAAERQLVLVGLRRQELRVVPLKASIFSMLVLVFSCADDLDVRAEEPVVAGVVAVGMRVDDAW
jgi:hypothetical protein